MIEGSRSGAGYGSIPLTDGSGSGSRRPKTCGSGSPTLAPNVLPIIKPVLWIRDILVRIRIRGSVLLFSSLTFTTLTENYLFSLSFSAYYFFKVHLHHFSDTKRPDFSVYVQDPRIFYKIMNIYTYTAYTKSKVDTQKNIKFENLLFV